MQDKHDTSHPVQLEFDFLTATETVGVMQVTDNVVRLQFGLKRSGKEKVLDEDAVLIERVLQNAQKLKW